jgi:phosphate transport system permease protein
MDRRVGERLVAGVLALCAGVSTLATAGIVVVLFSEAVGFFRDVSVVEFLTATRWTPLFREKHFGILPLLGGSALVAVGAALVAVPGGLLTAVFLSEYAGSRIRSFLRPTLEILAGIPTVVYGYFALTFVTPLLQGVIPGVGAFSALSASLVLGIMILPTVAAMSEDAIRSVAPALREAAYGLGATRVEVITRVVLPGGASGILASLILGLSRAFGETMVVTLAAGNSPRLTLNPLEAVQTLSAYILQAGQGNIAPDTLDYRTLFAVGTVLFVITMSMNLASQWVLSRSRQGRT